MPLKEQNLVSRFVLQPLFCVVLSSLQIKGLSEFFLLQSFTVTETLNV
jgi:hypothetical protein